MRRSGLLLAALLALSPAAHALSDQQGDTEEIVPSRDIPKGVKELAVKKKPPETPPVLRLIIHPLRKLRGMLITLPIMDTDPNRGVTGGFMPIWVLQEKDSDRIEQIHAPSITYNRNFLWTPTYRYYYYPQEDAALVMRGSLSRFEKEAMGHYEDGSILGTDIDALLRVQYNVDAGKRFFGIGPATSRHAEANYKEEYYELRVAGGSPLRKDSKWRIRGSNHLQSERIMNGPLPGLAGFDTLYPGVAPVKFRQSDEWRLNLDFDTRDHASTTSRGLLFQTFAETSVKGLASQFDYNRFGVDTRYFHKWPKERAQVTAVQYHYEQLTGSTPPFWLLPRLGGKYSLRAYGEGRYTDRGMMFANVEQRFTLHTVKMAGVTTEFELAPFAGAGTVFDYPGRYSNRYLRPVVGSAIRAVAKPQVVGSIDFGVGQEGLAVFMDINYSF